MQIYPLSKGGWSPTQPSKRHDIRHICISGALAFQLDERLIEGCTGSFEVPLLQTCQANTIRKGGLIHYICT